MKSAGFENAASIDRRGLLIGALAFPIAGRLPFASPAFAQGPWPNRTVTMVVPLAPGGQADLAARPVAAALEKILGRPVIVENRPGAGGALGNASVAKAEPDGHTLLMTISSFVVLPEADRLFDRKPLYETNQLVPIGRVLADPNILAVLSSSPWLTLDHLVEDAKKRPGQIPYSSSGNYGASHVSMEMFTQAAGIKLLHVPYRGVGPALTGLIGNQVSAIASARGPLAPHVEAGAVRILASWGGARTAELPNVPTFRELGYPTVEFYVWAGLFAPGNVPEPIIMQLRRAMREAMQSPQLISVFEKAGSPPAYLDGPDFARFIETDSARLIPAVRKIGKVE
jgi:tripartite-type tricarboxylate transporter receptor subunit TctC